MMVNMADLTSGFNTFALLGLALGVVSALVNPLHPSIQSWLQQAGNDTFVDFS